MSVDRELSTIREVRGCPESALSTRTVGAGTVEGAVPRRLLE
jgi:hypothetical protein